MPWSTKLQDLRKQRIWEPKILSLLSFGSLTKFPFSRVKHNFSWLLAAQPTTWLQLHFCLSLFILAFCCWRLDLFHDLPVYRFGLRYICIPHCFFPSRLASECLPCSLLDGLQMFLTTGLPSGHPSCSKSWSQLHFGHGIVFFSELKNPHLALITGLFSLCLSDNDLYHKIPESISTKMSQNKRAEKIGAPAVVRN